MFKETSKNVVVSSSLLLFLFFFLIFTGFKQHYNFVLSTRQALWRDELPKTGRRSWCYQNDSL